MDKKDEQRATSDHCTIDCLPDEIISMIMKYSDCRDIASFSSTCKQFNNMINDDQSLVAPDVFKKVCQNNDGDWLTETKRLYTIKQTLYSELISMSPKYYWRTADVTLEDVRSIFAIALSHNISYYYTIFTLQDLIKKIKKNVENNSCQKPYTLTEMYYAKVSLRHLIHTYLALKWVNAHIKNKLPPEIVVNFFLQWVDTDNYYPDEEVDKEIYELENEVEAELAQNHPTESGDSIKERCMKGKISEKKILDAVTHVIYRQRRMAVTSHANIDSLNIVKALKSKCGYVITVASVYQAVARRFGVQCELIAFPNHMFLEWKDNSNSGVPQSYTIDLKTGKLHPKRRCPFSQNNQNSNYQYYPDSLLQYIYTSYHKTMGAIQNWNTQNGVHLLYFLCTYDDYYNPYRNFLSYLLDLEHLPAMDIPPCIKYLNDDHLQILSSLAYLNNEQRTVNRSLVVKRHDSCVKFAVGMICYHKKYEYVCVIRAWDPTCAVEMQRRMDVKSPELINQPFYTVIAADQSDRYVAQENLLEVTLPTRLYHLEDHIAREFTHFDGFAYVPNAEKKAEYPNDPPVVDMFRHYCLMKTNVQGVYLQAQ